MSIDYVEIDIDRDTLRVLKRVYRKKSVTYGALESEFPKLDVAKAFRVLRDAQYVYGDFAKTASGRRGSAVRPEDGCNLWCTVHGKRYVEYRRVDWFRELRNWISFGLSVIATILSIVSILLQLL